MSFYNLNLTIGREDHNLNSEANVFVVLNVLRFLALEAILLCEGIDTIL